MKWMKNGRSAIVTALPLTSYVVPGTSYTSVYASTPTTYTGYAGSSAAAKSNIYASIQPQQAATIILTPVPVALTKVGTWLAVKPARAVAPKPTEKVFKGPHIPPKPQQLHYCEVCKISCAGPQTVRNKRRRKQA